MNNTAFHVILMRNALFIFISFIVTSVLAQNIFFSLSYFDMNLFYFILFYEVEESLRNPKMQQREEMYLMKSLQLMNCWQYQILASQLQRLFLIMW